MKLMAAMTCYGCVFQSSTCTTDERDLAEQLTVSIVDTFIAGLVSDRLNVTSTNF
ncbi:MAG: hypothetical protein ACE5GE_06910 [Phycisphaerae bacterium]